MRPRRLALSLIVSLSLAAAPAFADDPYAEYRIPAHHWLSWSGSLSADGSREVNQFPSGRSESSSLSGSGASGIGGGFDSDARSYAYGLELSVDAGRRAQSTASPEFGDSYVLESASESASGSLAFSRYLQTIPIGIAIGSNGAIGPGQRWTTETRRVSNPPGEDRLSYATSVGGYDAFAAVSASLYLGRVRDATPVYQVQVLEQRLLEAGTITHALSPAGRERLAALYTIQFDVAFAHQRPTKYFWQELERILRDDGALAEGGLDAYSVQRLLEPLTIVGSGFVARARGFSFGPQVALTKRWDHSSVQGTSSQSTYDHDTLVTSSEVSVDRRSNFHDEFILTGLFVDYHRPVGMRWQVDATSRALIPEEGKSIDWTSGAGIHWLVADRWFAAASFRHELFTQGHGSDRRPQWWFVNYGASVNYFLEDAWSFGLGWSGAQTHGYSFDRRDSFSLGVTYQLAGWLTAPAVFAPMRLSPPAN